MKINDLTEKLKARLPFKYDDSLSFHKKVEQEFEFYISRLREIDTQEYEQRFGNNVPNTNIRFFIENEEKFTQNLKEVIEHSRNGMGHKAFEKLKSALEETRSLDKKANEYWGIYKLTPDTPCFRIRKNTDTADFPNCIKHFPFQDVRYLQASRFSLPGFPCLYLGSSIQLCKMEKGMDINKPCLKASFQLRENTSPLSCIDIVPPTNLEDNNGVFSFLLLYPFYVTCLFEKDKSSTEGQVYFQEEYIVPQLLLSYVRENQEIDGIRYLSTYYRQGESIDKYINYVFPVTQIKDSGYDEKLMNKFEIKEQKEI